MSLNVVVFAALMLTGLSACQATTPTGAAGPQASATSHNSAKTAIVIKAAGETDGIAQEYDWIARNRPGWTTETQALLIDGNKPYDMLIIRKGSQTEQIYFDISSFLGR